MAKLKRVIRCFNCGAIVQCTDKNGDGYIDPEFMPKDTDTNQIIYCKSCYNKMKTVNNGMLEQDYDDEILRILDDAVASDARIIWVVDLFAFNGTFNLQLVNKVKSLEIMVVATKFGLFPKEYTKDAAIQYLKERFSEVGITPAMINIVTETSKMDASNVLKLLNDFRKGHDVYMIGSATSGKTSLINAGMKFYKNKTNRQIKTEFYPHTEIKVLSIPFTQSASLYELPGFSLVNSAYSKVGKDNQKLITPERKINVETKKLKGGDALLLGGVGTYSIVSGKETIYKVYTAEGVQLKKVPDKKLSEVFKKNLEKKELLPVSDRLTNYKDFDLFEYDMEDDKQMHDISILGLGWISFKAEGQIIRVLCPKGSAIKECLSKIK